MLTRYSLTQKIMAIMTFFVGSLVALLFLLISAKNEPIDFAQKELVGNLYQRPMEKILDGLAKSKVYSQRVNNGDKNFVDLLKNTVD